MQKVLGYVLLALCLFVAYQGYENSRGAAAEDMGQGLAKQAACQIDAACVLQSGPSIIKADVLRRRYQYRTDQGLVTVTCSRQYVFLGEWSCTSERGGM